MPPNKIHTDVLIVGAGYYGLTTACYLAERKIKFAIVGKSFSLWFNHILDDAALRSELVETDFYVPNNRYNLARFMRKKYPEKIKSYARGGLPIKLFREYLRSIQKNLKFSIADTSLVQLTKNKNIFYARLANGKEIIAKAVVIATGMGAHAYIPQTLRKLNSPRVIHVWDVKQYTNLKNKRILVVGAGQSAAEAIDHLKKKNTIVWVTRHPPQFYKDPIKIPSWLFKLLIHLSPYTPHLARPIKSIIPRNTYKPTITPTLKASLEDPSIKKIYLDINNLKIKKKNKRFNIPRHHQDIDIILSATGYRYEIQNLTFLSKDLRERLKKGKQGIVNRDFETKVCNLFMIGGITEPVQGIAQRFLFGARHAANQLAKTLGNRLTKSEITRKF